MNPAERALISPDDLRMLDTLPGHRDRRFVEAERAALTAVCAKLQNRGSLDVADVAQEFDSARDGHEDLLLDNYVAVLEKLSRETRRYIQGKLVAAAGQLQFSETRLDLFELAVEAPEIAEALLQKGCDRFASTLARQELRSVTLKEEVSDPSLVVPMTAATK